MSEDKELENLRRKKLEEMRSSRNPLQVREGSSSTGPSEVNDQNFSEFVKKNILVVIDCWAPWCGPCRMISPIIEQLSEEYAGRIIFGKLHVDNNRRIALEYQIMSIPTLLVFKNGILQERIVGAVSKSVLESKLEKYL